MPEPGPGNRPKRVLMLAKGLGLGGMERLLVESIPHLDRSTFAYEVAYFLPWKDDLIPRFEAAEIPVHCVNVRSDLDVTAPLKLHSLFNEREIELVHSHSPHPAAMARLGAWGTRVRALVHTEHSLPGSRRAVSQMANRLTHPLNDLTIAVSDDVAIAVDSGRLLHPRRLRVIRGGLDHNVVAAISPADAARARASLAIPSGHLIVGNVAHLRAQKGLDDFLRAAAKIAAECPSTSFVIVGREKEPGYQAQLTALAEQLEIGDRVRFTGFQSDPYPFLAAFDVFMMSSRYEGFPIALIEAMAMGKPVVSTNVGGVPEAITDFTNGILVDPGEPGRMAEQVIRLLEDEAERSRLGENARRTVRDQFSIRTMVGSIEAAYKEVL